MIVYDLKEFALKLKMKLENDSSPETAKKISIEIEKATHPNGNSLTSEEKDHIINYIQFPVYNHETGQAGIHDADNSEFLKLVAIVAKNVKGDK